MYAVTQPLTQAISQARRAYVHAFAENALAWMRASKNPTTQAIDLACMTGEAQCMAACRVAELEAMHASELESWFAWDHA